MQLIGMALQRAHQLHGVAALGENAIERAIILADGPRIEVEDLGLNPARLAPASERIRQVIDFEGSLQDVVGRATTLVERVKIGDTLASAGGNKTRAADMLGIKEIFVEDLREECLVRHGSPPG